jgi:hypothetical protein
MVTARVTARVRVRVEAFQKWGLEVVAKELVKKRIESYQKYGWCYHQYCN